MAIQNINELYDKLSANENFSDFNFGTADDFKSYLEELPEQKKEKFYNAWLEDEDISKDQFESLLKKKESGRAGILSSALGSIDFASPSVSKSEPQAIAPEVQAPEATAMEDVTAPLEPLGYGKSLAEGPGKPFPTIPKGRTFEVKPVDEQFAGQKKQIEEAGKEAVKKTIETQQFKKASFGTTAEGKAKTSEEASQDKLIKDVQTQNPFKNNEFVFEVPGAAEEMDASGNIVKKAITTTKIPTDVEIGEILFNNGSVKLLNSVDIGRISGRGTDVFDKETFKTYLQRQGLTPRSAEVVINNYIDKYVNTMSAEDTDFKLSKAKGETVAEKISNIRNQEDEYGLDLLAKQYGINVAEKAKELQSFMANRKRPGEAGYEQWNNQLSTLQKEMSNLVGGGERLYNPEDGKLYDRASAPKRAMVYKAYLDDAVKIYKNTDADKLKEIRSNLMDKVKFLEDQYDKTVGPEWRGKEFFKTFTSTMTEGQKDAMLRQFDMLDNYKAQLSAVNSRLLTNTDIEPATTDKTGQFVKGLKKALPGGDYASSYRTVKDDYSAYVDALEGEIELKPEEAEKKELTLGEEVFKGIGYSLPIMAEIIATRNIAPSIKVIRASKYFRPITRGALKVTGSKSFANLFTDVAANAAHGYITYAPTEETGATGVGETLFSQTVWDKIALEKISKGWSPLIRYLGRTAFGTVGETAEEFVGEYANALSETDFDWKKATEETFGKDISEFGKKLAVYASTSAVMSSGFNTPELFIKATRFNDVKKLAEEKLQNPEISEAEKEVIQASIKMMDATEKTLKEQEEVEGPVSTVTVEPAAEMEAPEGVTPPAVEVIPGEEGVGPVEGVAPEAIGPQVKTNLQEISKEVAQGGVTDVSLQKIEDYGKEIESGNVDFERFSPAEQRGLIEGGPIHVEATVITGKSDRGTDTQDDSNDRQEEIIKEYAQKKGIWTENAPAKLAEKYGDIFKSGKESLVWIDDTRGVVIKSSVTNQYPTLREALDAITLSNAYFPAAKITVIGFGTDAEGNFEIITEQPYIQGVDATEQEIKDYFNKLGFTENERLYQGKEAFGNEDIIFKDAAPKNVIKTPEGNIVPIDLIVKINKPELNANGTRTVPSTVAEEVAPTEVAPTEVTPTEVAPTEAAPEAEVPVTETAPEVTTPPTEVTPTEGTTEGYGSQNTIVTKEDYDQAVSNLRNPNVPSGFDFSKLGDLIKAGMYHIEAGSRKFADFSKKMVEQFGQAVKKYLPVVFRRSNTQFQQQQAQQPTSGKPKPKPKRLTLEEVKQKIIAERDAFAKANNTQSPSIIVQYLLSKGYSLGQIKNSLPEYSNYWQQKARDLFMGYVKEHQNKINERNKEIADFMNNNPTLEYEDIYDQLKDKYSDFELFKAFYEDGASPTLLDETFGSDYRQTIQNLIKSKNYNPDFIRDLDEDIRTRKIEKNLGESKSLYADLQDFASAEELLDAAAEVLGISGVEEAMKTATDKVRAENKKKAEILKDYGKVMKGGFKSEDVDLIKNISDILSFSGRMLRMGRGLFMTEKGLADLIIRNLSNITYKKDSNFAKTKKAFRVPEKTQQKIRELVKNYFETKAKLAEATAQVEDGANAFTDEAFDVFNKARAEHQKASTELKKLVNNLYGSRAPLISRWFTSMTSMALLSFRTIFVGLIGNLEMMLASMPRKTWVGKLLGWTRILADGIVGAQVSFKKGQGLAYEATKKGTGVGIDPSIYRKLAFQQGIQQIKDILRKGLTEQTSSEKDFLQGYGEIDGVKDFQMGFKMISKMIKNIAGKEKMTDEEFAAAFDKMLIALEEKDANGNPKLAAMHSKGYYSATALLKGFFGSIPTITGRAIALSGDRVFYQYGYYEFLAAYANSKGITDPAEVKRFIALNSVGDSDAGRAAERAANKRIFAQNNAIVRFFGSTKAKLDQIEQNIYGAKIKKKVQGKGVQAAATGVGAYPVVAARIALNAFSPFVTIPSNVVSKYLRIGVPVFPLVMAVRTQMQLNTKMNEYQERYSLKDNAEMSETTKKKMEADRVALFEKQRLAAQYWTEFFQGAQLAGLAMLLIQTGSVGAPYGDDDESKQRARAAGIAQQDAGKLNLSHLFDVVTGKETRGRVAKKGDITIDYRNLGMAGFSISTWASADAYLKTQQLKNKKLMGADEDIVGMINAHLITESLQNGITQLGFIQNISNFISGIKSDKGAEALASSLLTTVLTVPTLSYGVLSPFERIEGIGSDPLRGYHPDLESSDVFMGEVGARVWTKLTARSPLFGFGLRKEDGTFAAPLKALGFTPSEFYRPQIGPHGERLYKKSTFWDTRSGSMADKFLAFAQASIDPVNMSDYEGFVSQVKPFDMKKEYRKGDFIEWNNNIWVVTKDKIKGLSPKDAQLGEDKDYILLDTKKNFLDPDRWRRDKEGTRKTQILFDFVNEYEKATGDRKEYGLFSKLYTDPVKFKDEDGEFAVYVPMEEQRKLSILRGEAMARSWDSDEVQNRLDIIQKTAEDENLSDADWKKQTKELFLDYMKGAMDEDQNRSGGLIDRVNEAIKGVEESPEYAAIVRDGIVRSVKEGLLTEAEFNRLAKHTVAGNFIASMDKSKLKFRK